MTQEKTSLEKASDWFKNSATIKLLGIGFIMLLLLIPLTMVRELIQERMRLQDQVKREVSADWGRTQHLSGPLITIPFDRVHTYQDATTGEIQENRVRDEVHFLPEALSVNGEVTPQDLHKGIYHTTVYETDLHFDGKFTFPHHKVFDNPNIEVLWDEAQIGFSIPDLRGVQNEVFIQFDGIKYRMESGLSNEGPINRGIGTLLVLDPEEPSDLAFDFDLVLRGSDGLGFQPWGKVTDVSLNSSWTAPQYYGSFPPDFRNEDTSDGFQATWKVLDLNRNIPQSFLEAPQDLFSYDFGVRLFEEVSDYTSTERSAKYAVLFIALTFLTFFVIQLTNHIRLHPVQFLLVGLALCVFYVLLLALGEQVGFGKAYLIASIANILLVSAYMKAAFTSTRLALVVGAIMSVLYFFIYVIIQLANYSLLVGSIGLFIALAAVMFASRKMNWYSLKQGTPALTQA